MTPSCSLADEARRLFSSSFETGDPPLVLGVPGRVNLIGEHIDYHDLRVLPMALQRGIWIAFRPRSDAILRAVSAGGYGRREFAFSNLEPGEAGDWSNYLKAAAQAVSQRWLLTRGIEVAIVSDLPPAAGLASSSALLVGITLALLAANSIPGTVHELMEILPEGEQFTGTRGGAMDHAVVLAARGRHALLVQFAPLAFQPIEVPKNWCFLVAHSLTRAEKSGAARTEYNSRRSAGSRALERLGFHSYSAALAEDPAHELHTIAERAHDENRLASDELRAFLHVTSEAQRVEDAVSALQLGDIEVFGKLLSASHASLRDQLGVSLPAIDELVEAAMESGAEGARLTGAGFGGCVVVLCRDRDRECVLERLRCGYYSSRADFDPQNHLFVAEPSPGALYDMRLAGFHADATEDSRHGKPILY